MKNIGNYDGKCLVKVYVREKGNSRLNRRLAGFSKVFVPRGEEAAVNIALSRDVLSLFEDSSRLEIIVE